MRGVTNMFNKVVLVGRLTKNLELKHTDTGIANVRFTIAVNRTFSNQSGEKEADFISCVAWRKQAENMANFLSKGSLIGIDGRIQTKNFEGQDGKRVYMTDVVAENVQFLDPKAKQEGQQNQQPNQQQQYQQSNQQQQYQQSNQQQQYQQPSQQQQYQQPNQQQQYQQPSQQQQYQQQQQGAYSGAGIAGQQPSNRYGGSDDDLPF